MTSSSTRTYVVTGAASGIGKATCEHLARDGHRVVDVDLRGASIEVDLGTPAGREAMVDAVGDATGGRIDALFANAGVSNPEDLCVTVNYFGAVATLEGLRPFLAAGDQPRAVATCSSSVVNHNKPELVDALLAGDEAEALRVAEGSGYAAYPSSKRALARWLRRQAPTEAWAGAGIGLNGVAPGVVQTPMTAPLFDSPAMVEAMGQAVPMPYGGHAQPEHVAELVCFLLAAETQRITGQVIFVDGGCDAVLQGDDIWSSH